MSPTISVDPAPPGERALIEGLFQFYIYDFAEMFGGDPEFDVGSDGRFSAHPHIAGYWGDTGRIPFVIRFDGRPAGFILVNRISHSHAVIDHAVAEFFVMRPFRRRGVGAAAAHTVFTRLPGRWELAIAAVNQGGRRFWPKVVSSAPGVSEIETLDLPEGERSRRILSFRIASDGRR